MPITTEFAVFASRYISDSHLKPNSFKLMTWSTSGDKKMKLLMDKVHLNGIHYVDIRSSSNSNQISKHRYGQIEKVQKGDFVHMYHGSSSQTANGAGVHYRGVVLSPYEPITYDEKMLFAEMSSTCVLDIDRKIEKGVFYRSRISWEKYTLTDNWREILVQPGCGTVIPLKIP